MSENEPEESALTKEEQAEEDRLVYAWLQPSPIYVDHYTAKIMPGDGIVRISFGEWVRSDYPAIFRLAVALPTKEAKRLHRTLGRILAEEDKRILDEAKKLVEKARPQTPKPFEGD
jgi:hypothetical protein